MKIFVDTSVLVALNNTLDSTYLRALELSKSFVNDTVELVTSNHVIAETLTVLSQKVSHDIAIEFNEKWAPKMEVIHIDEELEEAAFDIFKKIKSKNVSFVDCTSFALMRHLKISKVFTFDMDFKKQGFRLVE